MTATRLGRILNALELDLNANGTESLLSESPLGEARGSEWTLAVTAPGLPLSILDRPVELAGEIHGVVRVVDGPAPSPFAAGAELSPPRQHCFAELAIRARTAASTRVRLPAGVVALKLDGSCAGELDYQNLWALPSEMPTARVLQKLVDSTVPLHRLGPTNPADGQAHVVIAEAELDLGLEAALSARLDLGWEPFVDISRAMEAHFKAVVKTALGLTLLEEMKLAVGRLDTTTPGWTRIRIDRRHQRRLTLGASCALTIRYDLASPLIALLDEAVDNRPWQQVQRASAELAKTADLLQAAGDGDWPAVRAALSEEALETLEDLLGVDDLWARLGQDPELHDLLAAVRRTVAAYDQWIGGDLLDSLWQRLLGRVELGPGAPLRQALETIARLDPGDLESSVEQLLDERQRLVLELVEALTGLSLEELLVEGGLAREALEEAIDLARRSLRFLEGMPAEVLRLLEGLAGRSGIAKAVEQLRVVSDLGELRKTSRTTARRLVGRLLDKAVDQTDEHDLAAIRRWATRMSGALEHVSLERLDARLRDLLERLDGQAGFTVALELDRLSRSTALLDLETPPELMERAAPLLAAGSVSGLLELASSNAGEEEPASCLLRDCVFTTRRVRTAASDLLLSLIGWTRHRTQVVEESRVSFKAREDGAVQRTARYSSALVLSHTEPDRTSLQAATWLTLRGRSTHRRPAPAAAFASLEPELRISISRRDPKTSGEELLAIETLLYELGFVPTLNRTSPELARTIPEGSATRLALTLRLGPLALASLLDNLDDREGWDLDILNGAVRWLDEGLLPSRLPFASIRKGWAMARVVASEEYNRNWTAGRRRFEARHAGGFTLSTARGEHCRLAPLARYPALLTLQTVRRSAPGGLAGLRDLLSASSTRPRRIVSALHRFARTMRLVDPGGWPNPMFHLWLLVARLTRLAPEHLHDASGLATLRFETEGEWQPAISLKLEHGLPYHPLGAGVFPRAAPRAPATEAARS